MAAEKRGEREKREDAITGGEKLQDRSKTEESSGRESASKVRKTKTLSFCIEILLCYKKGKNPKGVLIGREKRVTTNPRLLIFPVIKLREREKGETLRVRVSISSPQAGW